MIEAIGIESIESEFKKKVCEKVRLLPEGIGRFIIDQPFSFDDGDHFVVLLKQINDGWYICDEGHTLMHMSYKNTDLSSSTRAALFDKIQQASGLRNDDGDLLVKVEGEAFGDALFTYLQALNKITDLEFLNRERVRSTFLEDAKGLVRKAAEGYEGLVFNYVDQNKDPDGYYPIDCKINGRLKPVFIFFISNNEKCQQATITSLKFENWKVPFEGIGIYEDMTAIAPRSVAQFADIANKTFSSLAARDRIEKHIAELITPKDQVHPS